MNKNDLEDFAKIITSISELYGKNITEFMLDTYWNALEKFEFEEIKQAIQKHVSNPDNGQFMPKPADIVRFIDGSSGTQAFHAWSLVELSARSIGANKTVIFDDPIIHAVIWDMGGWIRLCHTEMKELPFRAKDFEKRYAGYVIRPPQSYPKKLTGIWESLPDSSEQSREPVLIGNKGKALDVYNNGIERKLSYSPLVIGCGMQELKIGNIS